MYIAGTLSAKKTAFIGKWIYWTESPQRVSGKRFRIFSSLEDAATDSDLRPAAIEAIEKIGVPVEELDI